MPKYTGYNDLRVRLMLIHVVTHVVHVVTREQLQLVTHLLLTLSPILTHALTIPVHTRLKTKSYTLTQRSSTLVLRDPLSCTFC